MSLDRWSLAGTDELFFLANQRVGDWGRRLMHLVPAPAVRLMKRRVQSWPGARQENRCSLCLVFRIGHIVFSIGIFLSLISFILRIFFLKKKKEIKERKPMVKTISFQESLRHRISSSFHRTFISFFFPFVGERNVRWKGRKDSRYAQPPAANVFRITKD